MMDTPSPQSVIAYITFLMQFLFGQSSVPLLALAARLSHMPKVSNMAALAVTFPPSTW